MLKNEEGYKDPTPEKAVRRGGRVAGGRPGSYGL